MARNNKKRSRLISVLIGIVLILVGFLLVNPFVDHWIYPIKYKNHIFDSAQLTGVDPFLVMAIIRVETKFNPYKESHAGAEGLMQLMPDTVKLAVTKGMAPPLSEEYVMEPAVNIQIGSWYLSLLRKQFQGNEAAAIAAYNAGPGNVRKWMREGTWDGTRHNLSHIPFGETRNYVKRVYYFYEKYTNLHNHRVEKK